MKISGDLPIEPIDFVHFVLGWALLMTLLQDRERNPSLFCQSANRLREREPFNFDEKLKYIPSGPTAETMKNLLGRADDERRGLLVMKGAEAGIILSRFF